MKISLNWLKEFVDVAADPKKLKVDLKALGLGAETVSPLEDDWVFDLEITTNRPDCLSHYGVAREVATLYRQTLGPIKSVLKESGPPASGEVSIEIAAPELCARYCGRVIQNVQVKPSPPWLSKRLEAVGQRSINNVADVTNYVLMELGHPLHAFDLARLRDRRIIVRRARAGEPLKTLDGIERKMTAENLVIADGKLPVALAGVMGGEESEITTATKSVLLESAWFDPLSIRRTSKANGLHTEASHRFERGADIEMARLAIDRAAGMIAEVAGGSVLPGVIDVYPRPWARRDLKVRASEIRRILGAAIGGEEVEGILRALGCEVKKEGDTVWWVEPPPWRLDITREVDFIEELARVHGYDQLPMRVRPAPPRFEPDQLREKELKVSEILMALGYREIIANSMVDPKENARFTDRPPVILQNPLSLEASAMRSTSVPGMVHALQWNLDRGQVDLRLFEMGKNYFARRDSATGLPGEERILTLGMCGNRPRKVLDEAEKPVDFFDLKGDVEGLLDAFDLPELRIQCSAVKYLAGEQSASFVSGDHTLVTGGELRRAGGAESELPRPVWIAEIDLDRLFKFSLKARKFTPFSKFPAVRRDFSLLVPQEVRYDAIQDALRNLHLEYLRDFKPVDRFFGERISAECSSLLLRVMFQSPSKTLTRDEIDDLSKQVVAALTPLGIRLRS